MSQKSPFDIVKSQYVTEKAVVLAKLRSSESNPSVRRCETPKHVYLVDPRSNKTEIARAVEQIHADKNAKVLSVNTIVVKPKIQNRRGNRRPGRSTLLKKAIVTFAPNELLNYKETK
jgi:large subunit ribosomal protein L23